VVGYVQFHGEYVLNIGSKQKIHKDPNIGEADLQRY
jgi:hypothetical protein